MTIDWNQVRGNYHLPNEKVFFETPYFGAMSDGTTDVQMDCLTSLQTKGSTMYKQTIEKAENIRTKILEMTNATQHHAALISDVSTPMGHLVEMLIDKKIVLLEKDFPSVTAPWVGRKCDIEWIERGGMGYPLAKIEKELKNGAEVLAMSWVMYNSGLKMDIKAIGELCQKYGVVFIVDATQGLGANALNLNEVHADVLLATCYKWLLAGYGTGVAIARKDFEAKYEFQVAGHCSILEGKEDVKDLKNYVSGVKRFELGHVKTQQIFALHHSLNELMDIGFENIQRRTQMLHDHLVEELKAIAIEILTPSPQSANIVMIEGNEKRVNALKAANVAFTYRHGLIRLGIYFYNNEEDIQRLVQVLK